MQLYHLTPENAPEELKASTLHRSCMAIFIAAPFTTAGLKISLAVTKTWLDKICMIYIIDMYNTHMHIYKYIHVYNIIYTHMYNIYAYAHICIYNMYICV